MITKEHCLLSLARQSLEASWSREDDIVAIVPVVDSAIADVTDILREYDNANS